MKFHHKEDLDLKSDLDVKEEVSKKAGVGLKETSAPHFHNIVVNVHIVRYFYCASPLLRLMTQYIAKQSKGNFKILTPRIGLFLSYSYSYSVTLREHTIHNSLSSG